MRPITRVSPVSAACRLRWSTAGTDGAWATHRLAVIQTHPDTMSGAKTAPNSSLSWPRLLVGNWLEPLRAPQQTPAAPTAFPKSP